MSADSNPKEAAVSTADVSARTATEVPGISSVDMKLEVVLLGVSDVDRAKAFYESLDWRLDADVSGDDGQRVVQLTPPGSTCSIIFGDKITSAAPGSGDLLLAVTDVDAARADLVARGVGVSEVFHDASGGFYHAGTEARVPGPDPDGRSYFSFASFNDPDGNRWVLQELTTRLPGR